MILFESDKVEEMDVNFDKLRRVGSLVGWQRQIYNFIVHKIGSTYLLKIMNLIHDKAASSVPDGTDPEQIKEIIKLAFIDYVDSSM